MCVCVRACVCVCVPRARTHVNGSDSGSTHGISQSLKRKIKLALVSNTLVTGNEGKGTTEYTRKRRVATVCGMSGI